MKSQMESIVMSIYQIEYNEGIEERNAQSTWNKQRVRQTKRNFTTLLCHVSSSYHVPVLVNLSMLVGRNSIDAAWTVYASKPSDNAPAICVYFISIEKEISTKKFNGNGAFMPSN